MIKLFCKICGVEIFKELMLKFKEVQNYTLWEVEEECFCDEHRPKKEIKNEQLNS